MNQVIIVGAGITGLTAANYLHKMAIPFKILEAADHVGGRVSSRIVDDYIVDEGFQVFLTAYPEAQHILNYEKLELDYYDPGALIMQDNGKLDRVGDPFRQLSAFIPSMTSDIGSITDKLKLLKLRTRVKSKTIEEIFATEETTSLQYLQNLGVSQKMISRFFQPFFSGIFLENKLDTSSRMLEFIYKMFSEGFAALPKNGMKAISEQLASNLPTDSIVFNSRVESIDKDRIITQGGENYPYDHCIIATEATEVKKLVQESVKTTKVGTTHLHFRAEEMPYDDKLIALNHKPNKIINTISVLNAVQSAYAKKDALISVSLVGTHDDKSIEANVKREAKHWFPQANKWELIDKQDISYALPTQKTVNYANSPIKKGKILIAGDHIQNGSMNAAMKSGRQSAEIISKIFSS